MDNRPIGILDSGLGGLTAVNALRAVLPNESFIYVGDTARVPYGEKDVATIHMYANQLIQFLQDKGVKAIVVACGTISSNVNLDALPFNFPIIDVVRPGVKACLGIPNLNRIGVIATAATIKSGIFPKMLKEENPRLVIEALACPMFVPLIEGDFAERKLSHHIAEAYLGEWQKNPIDALILGCTHYPLLSPIFQKILPNTILVDIAQATIEYTKKFLTKNGMLNNHSGNSEVKNEFYASGDITKFNKMSRMITGLDIDTKKINWD